MLGHGEHPRLPPRVRAQPSAKGEGRQRGHRREPSRVRGKMSFQGLLPGGGPFALGPGGLFIDRGGCPSQGWCLGQQGPTGQDACWRHLESRVLCSGQIQSLGGLGVPMRTERGQGPGREHVPQSPRLVGRGCRGPDEMLGTRSTARTDRVFGPHRHVLWARCPLGTAAHPPGKVGALKRAGSSGSHRAQA